MLQLDRQAVGGDRDAAVHLSAPLFFKSRCTIPMSTRSLVMGTCMHIRASI